MENKSNNNFLISRLSHIFDAYQYLNYSFTEYLIKLILPSILVSSVIFGSRYLINNNILSTVLIFGSLLPIFVTILYPILKRSRDVNEINSKFFIFITQLTVLAMSTSDRVEIFRIIANEDDYGALASEINQLVSLIDTFNLSLDDAARRRSKHTNSSLMSEFYEKLSYSVGSGQSIENFLLAEQEDAQESFSSEYNSKVKTIEIFSELFISILMSMSFLFTFSLLIPFLIGINSEFLIIGVSFFFIVVQMLFIVIINSNAPQDKFWYSSDRIFTKKSIIVNSSVIIGILIVLLITTILLIIQPNVPIRLYPVISVSPLLVPSVIILYYEKKIRKVEEQFPSFIRSLGSIEAVKQTSTRNVLKDLKENDFETLNQYIESLYRRLKLTIDSNRSWDLFSAHIGSNLIKSFSDMYVYGREQGGDTKQLGEIISQNFRQILKLRDNRATINRKLLGTLYGVSIATSTVFFIGFEILNILIDVTESMPSTSGFGNILNTGVYNIIFTEGMVFFIVIVNALSVSFMMRFSNRKYIGGFVIHFTIITILSFIIGTGIEMLTANLFKF